MRNRSSRTLFAVLCFLLVIGPVSLFAGKQASAQVIRVAVVTALKGEVSVLKSGGAKPFKAFKNMSLNEGDQIATGADSQVVLDLASAQADKDSITIAANSVVNFSKLKDGGGTKTKMSVWAGSLWVKVKSVSNASDQFEVETPTSIMGVRGTQFYISVDPATGLTHLFLAAGVVQSLAQDLRKDATDKRLINELQTIYPSQQLAEAHDQAELLTEIAIVDMQSFIAQASADIIRAILASAQSIQAENQAYLEKVKQSLANNPGAGSQGGEIVTQDDLKRLANNLNNLLSVVAQEALKQNKIDRGELEKLAKEAGSKPDGTKLIDLSGDAAIQLSDLEKEQQLKLQQLLKDKQAKAAQEKAAKEAELKKQELLEKLKKAKELLEQNKKKEEELQKQKDLAYFNQLTADEQNKFNESRKDNGLAPIGTESGTKGSSTNGSPSASAKASLAFSDPLQATKPVLNTGRVDLNLVFSGFAASQGVMGYEVEVDYPSDLAAFDQSTFASLVSALQYRAGASGFNVEPEGMSVPNANSIDDFRVIDGTSTSRLIYTVAKFSGDPSTVSDGTIMVKLPFNVHLPSASAQPGSGLSNAAFHIRSITVVDANGDPIGVIAGDDVTVQVQQTIN